MLQMQVFISSINYYFNFIENFLPMFFLTILFWICLFIIFYAFVGYGFFLYVIVKIKRILNPRKDRSDYTHEPEVSFIVPCYNEASIIEEKIQNTLSLDYPAAKLQVVFITDGSDDGTPDMVRRHPGIKLLHESLRAGKSAAENRAMEHVTTPIVIFSDANTHLAPETIKELVKHYADPEVGAVSGEKRIMTGSKNGAAAAGEGIYWKYESFLKRFDSELLTIVGAAGELFSFRTSLYTPLEQDTILDDFMLSLRIAARGYRVIYEPRACASETASASVKEEMKRKIRICAGGWQAMVRLAPLLNPLAHFTLTFEYISHRVLRWSIAPLCLFLLIPINIILAAGAGNFFKIVLCCQVVFYTVSLFGWFLENRQIRIKALFIPYYFFIMNYSVVLGFFRYMKGAQSAAWERSQRGAL